jgi:hypothetical protein
MKRAIELVRIECQPYISPDEGVMIADCLGQIKERSYRIEKDSFDHEKRNVQRQTPSAQRLTPKIRFTIFAWQNRSMRVA